MNKVDAGNQVVVELPDGSDASASDVRREGWMARRWLTALVERVGIEQGRLDRGPTYADRKRLTDLALEAGSVSADVRQSRRLTYEAELEIKQLSDKQWNKIIELMSERTEFVAAAIDRDLDEAFLAKIKSAKIRLLPGKGEVTADCTCPDDSDVCKHTAGLMHAVADELRQDPFVLFALRGRTIASVVDEAIARRAELATTATPDGPVVHPDDLLVHQASWDLDDLIRRGSDHRAAVEAPDDRRPTGPASDEVDLAVMLPLTPAPSTGSVTLGGLTGLAHRAIERARVMLEDPAPDDDLIAVGGAGTNAR